MDKLDYVAINLKVGLEIHQQLSTGRKLFCECSQKEMNDYEKTFSRQLRMSKSELGKIDPAAKFERQKEKKINYFMNSKNSCLVEQDEEPPHGVDLNAKKTTLIIAAALKSNIFAEVFPMRKMVIDGSNTSGFQRTMLVSQGGHFTASNHSVGVQAICLEEDASKLLGDENNVRKYDLGRLGTPLIEIALDPVSATPSEIRKIALHLGRLLRITRKVARGIGSIRQDVNVSIMNGAVVEVKGVQRLDQLEKTIDFEAMRQDGLIKIAKKLSDCGCNPIDNKAVDVTKIMPECDSKIIKNALRSNYKISALKLPNYSGILGYSPYDGVRLGSEIAQRIKSYGIGGIFHSDELPNYGIDQKNVSAIKSEINTQDSDGFILVAAPDTKMNEIISIIVNRINAAFDGVLPETRMSMQDGKTVFLRPRPGSSRMYPETDVPILTIHNSELLEVENCIPKPWEESLSEFGKKYDLNIQLAEQMFDSDYYELFEDICTSYANLPSNFVASSLCSTLTNSQRSGMDTSKLNPKSIKTIFEKLNSGSISKESVEIIFNGIMSGKYDSVQSAIEKTMTESISVSKVLEILDEIFQNNSEIIKKHGTRAASPLMGIAMKKMRGKASGKMISNIISDKLKLISDKNNMI